jgi:hypothetical protein
VSEARAREVLGLATGEGTEQALAAFSSKAGALKCEITACVAEDKLDALEQWKALTSALEELVAPEAPNGGVQSRGASAGEPSYHAGDDSDIDAHAAEVTPTVVAASPEPLGDPTAETKNATEGLRAQDADVSDPESGAHPKPETKNATEGLQAQDAEAAPALESSAELPRRSLTWPAVPSTEEARQTLTAWAENKRLVSNETFVGDLEIADASIARIRVTRLVETRSVQRLAIPGGNPPNIPGVFASSLDVVDVGPATNFDECRWDFLQQGSVVTSKCNTCTAGRVTCRACAGRGIHACPTTQRCPSCGGSGTTYVGPLSQGGSSSGQRQPCRTCAGRGQIPCRKCNGRGQKMCILCLGQGSHQCSNCKGTGVLTSFVQGTILRKQACEDLRWSDDPPSIGKLNDDRWPPFQRYVADTVPDGLPAGASSLLAAALKQSVAGELLRRVDISVLPITRATHGRDADRARDAYIVGPEKAVQAKGVRRVPVSKRLAIMAAILVVVLVTVVVLALVISSR